LEAGEGEEGGGRREEGGMRGELEENVRREVGRRGEGREEGGGRREKGGGRREKSREVERSGRPTLR
jgi:hypothetical protein